MNVQGRVSNAVADDDNTNESTEVLCPVSEHIAIMMNSRQFNPINVNRDGLPIFPENFILDQKNQRLLKSPRFFQ